MFVVLWEYEVSPANRENFEATYSAKGKWAELFSRGQGFLSTELLQDPSAPQRYLTIDRWDSEKAYQEFMILFEKEYKEMDAVCDMLTEGETLLGKWETL